MKHFFLFTLILFGMLSCSPKKNLPTVDQVDLYKYQGKWYEIARLPNKFEKGLECATAEYRLLENGKIEVINRGVSIEDHSKKSEAKGKAWLPNTEDPGKLRVSFFWPFAGDYYILKLDTEYQYVLVGSPNMKYLWILARTKDLDETIYNTLVDYAKFLGFEIKNLIKVSQDCS